MHSIDGLSVSVSLSGAVGARHAQQPNPTDGDDVDADVASTPVPITRQT